MPEEDDRRVAIVLAGGESRRFGSDKLDALVHGDRLLDLTTAGLPAGIEVIVVGPARTVRRQVRFVREQPPGGGPAAGLVAGLRAALESDADRFLVLPGDAPHAGEACGSLLAGLDEHPEAIAAVAVDQRGVEQPLQLALRRAAAVALIAAAGAEAGRGASARGLVRRLEPPPAPVVLPAIWCRDIDTPDDLAFFPGRPITMRDG